MLLGDAPDATGTAAGGTEIGSNSDVRAVRLRAEFLRKMRMQHPSEVGSYGFTLRAIDD